MQLNSVFRMRKCLRESRKRSGFWKTYSRVKTVGVYSPASYWTSRQKLLIPSWHGWKDCGGTIGALYNDRRNKCKVFTMKTILQLLVFTSRCSDLQKDVLQHSQKWSASIAGEGYELCWHRWLFLFFRAASLFKSKLKRILELCVRCPWYWHEQLLSLNKKMLFKDFKYVSLI